MKYVDLAVDNRSDSTDALYTYGCEKDDIEVGRRVYVQFAQRKKLIPAYVFSVSDEPSGDFKKLKYVSDIDEEVVLSEEMIRTASWMRKRYLCRYIDAAELFTPAGTALKSGRLRDVLPDAEGEPQDIKELTAEQKKALDEIRGDDESRVFLLHGVTGSGKTEIYMRLIADVLGRGKGAIMLLPEISLTKQITDRFIARFGRENIAILHSRLSPGERHDEWIRLRSGSARIAIGARSAVFAPMDDIGLIILDEEHEPTYKSDMSPKYETVEVALKRATDHGGKVVLGSATPSVVSYSRSEQGLYRRIRLTERYNRVRMPDVRIVDMRQELRRGIRSVISDELREETERQLAGGKQVIYFLNRRGYSTFVSCRSCGYVAECPNCGISMTYHKDEDLLSCHYCGRTAAVPAVCPECGSGEIGYFGAGTEKIDETVKALFPGAAAARLDLDTMKRKGSIERILNDFGKRKTDILIGTQVVAKGLDFRNVGLVGVLQADAGLNIPDFRSAERTFQLITQAAGRAGRGDETGKVLIQTYAPGNYAIQAAAANDYEGFYRREMEYRKARGYPPFADFIQLIFQSKDRELAEETAAEWEREIPERVSGGGGRSFDTVFASGPMIVADKREGYKHCLIIRCPAGQRKRYFALLGMMKEELVRKKEKVHVIADVDPYSMWRS